MRNSRQNIADHLRVAVPETGDAVNVHSISRQRHFESLVNSSDDAIVSKTLDGVVTSWNPAAERIFGYTAAEMIGQKITRIFPEDRLHEEKTLLAKGRKGEKIDHFETRRRRKDGREIPVSITIAPIRDERGDIIGLSKIARDISSQVEAMRTLRRFEAIVESSDDAIIGQTLDGVITSWNRAAERIFGFSAAEMIDQTMARICPDERLPEEDMILERVARGDKVDHFETVRCHKDGREIQVSVTVSPLFDDDGTIVGASKIARDISDQIEAENLIRKQANIDVLTGIPNRRFFMEKAEVLMRHADIEADKLALFFVDLDNFKHINDTYGHEFGDRILTESAARIQSCLRKSDYVGRLGGDEFLVLLPTLSDRDKLGELARKILNALNVPVAHEGIQLVTNASIGISIYPDNCDTLAELISTADQALYEIKKKGKNGYQMFSVQSYVDIKRDKRLRLDLLNSIYKNELTVLFQPIVSLGDNQVKKLEALLRWHHEDLGNISPLEFIPIAEEIGFINELTAWVFEQVVSNLTGWVSRYGSDFQVSINKSPIQFFQDDDTPSIWSDKLSEAGLSTANLLIEITESSLMHKTNITERKLKEFKSKGIEIAIDDFGTGYSSLAYLNRFNIEYIKIDKMFVNRICESVSDFYLCEAIIAMAHKLKLKVVAEGIETVEQRNCLTDMGCDYGQGYLFSKPIAAEEIDDFIEPFVSS